MAEFLAVAGAAASILQIVQIGTIVIQRIAEYSSAYSDVPDAFRHISNRLVLLNDALRLTKEKIENEDTLGSTRKAFKPVLKECAEQIEKLSLIIDRALPKECDSDLSRKWKAVKSMKYDSEIKRMDDIISDYMNLMTQHHVIANAVQGLSGPKTPLKPISTCPFEREPDFIYRDVLGEVTTQSKPGSKLALMGIGGVGKSRIAIEYGYRLREASPQTWVFWVCAKDQAAVAADFRKIAQAVRIPGWDEKDTDVFGLVRDWFRNESNGPWVMILDNVDDSKVLTAPAPNVASPADGSTSPCVTEIREFVKASQNGAILVTSRNREAAQMITGNCAHHIDVEEMNETEALALLKSKLNSKVIYTEGEAAELVKTIDYMPLAISQIATNISINYPRLTISKAIEKLNNPGQDTIPLLETSLHETSRDVHRSNSIVKTWHLSFQYVRETSPSAARLLSLMCLFDRQGIPQAMLKRQYGEDAITAVAPPQARLSWWKRIRRRRLRSRWRKRSAENKTTTAVQKEMTNFDDDWRVLTDFALIKTDTDGLHFNMHRLVQHTTRRWLEINGELRAWTRRYVGIMEICFPQKPEYENRAICRYLFPHAQQAAAYQPTNDEALSIWAPLIFNVAAYACSEGNYAAAEPLSRVVFNLFKSSLGEENADTLRSSQQLGDILQRLERKEEAETIYRFTLLGRQKVLGQHHEDTWQTLGSLGRVLQDQGKMEEGDEIFKQRLDAKERVLGADDRSTQMSLHSIAVNFFLRGMFQEAEDLQRRACEQAVTACGEASELALFTMSMLASTLKMQGNYDEAEALCRKVLGGRQNNPGCGDYLLFNSMVNLGEILELKGRYEEAGFQYRQAISGFKNLRTHEHANVLDTQDRLAMLLAKQKNFVEAEALVRDVISTRERVLEGEKPDTHMSIWTLAHILDLQGQCQDALPLFDRAYVEAEKLLGADDLETRELLNDLNRAKNKQLEWALDVESVVEGNMESGLRPPLLMVSNISPNATAI